MSEHNCINDRRLSNLEATEKEHFKEIEKKMDTLEDRISETNLILEGYINQSKEQILNLKDSLNSLTKKMDKNLDTQKNNTWMFLTTLIFTMVNVLISYLMR